MDPNALVGMIFTLVLMAMVGGFILLLPITRRLGLVLEAKLQEKQLPTGPSREELEKMRELVHVLEAEVRLLAERQEFTEQLIARQERRPLPAADASG
jgi:cell division protein FtsB